MTTAVTYTATTTIASTESSYHPTNINSNNNNNNNRSSSSSSSSNHTAHHADEYRYDDCDRRQQYHHHEDWRIALYYCYVDIPNVQQHVDLQQDLCEDRNLKGRIRVSVEGINGVLSGRFSSLKDYERIVQLELQKLQEPKEEEEEMSIHLDVKYCLLRNDLSIEAQLFESLVVKETKTVISLCDQAETAASGSRSSNNSNRRRRRRRKASPEEKEQQQFWQDLLQTKPSRHLSSKEWNEKLDQAAANHASAKDNNSDSSSTNNNNNTALLLDVRNVYESRVGHFATPHVPTLLTNTRKYSDLPELLATNEHVQKSDQIFMYCTGGVRCERVSQLVQTLYPTKQVFQLQGGIQTYLQETVGGVVEQKQQQQQQQQDSESSSESSSGDHNANKSKFHGKNFVFDPRRTDPVHAGTTIGRCLICGVAHDDYDNGHAPSENKEARCNTCRMLILICNDCRPNYQCWGEEEEGEEKHRLYCGGVDRCVHEGSAPEPELLVRGEEA
jgi:predicted sulfurtransferase